MHEDHSHVEYSAPVSLDRLVYLFGLFLFVSDNNSGHVRTLPLLYKTFSEHLDQGFKFCLEAQAAHLFITAPIGADNTHIEEVNPPTTYSCNSFVTVSKITTNLFITVPIGAGSTHIVRRATIITRK